jgi:hypothetical protein
MIRHISLCRENRRRYLAIHTITIRSSSTNNQNRNYPRTGFEEMYSPKVRLDTRIQTYKPFPHITLHLPQPKHKDWKRWYEMRSTYLYQIIGHQYHDYNIRVVLHCRLCYPNACLDSNLPIANVHINLSPLCCPLGYMN